MNTIRTQWLEWFSFKLDTLLIPTAHMGMPPWFCTSFPIPEEGASTLLMNCSNSSPVCLATLSQLQMLFDGLTKRKSWSEFNLKAIWLCNEGMKGNEIGRAYISISLRSFQLCSYTDTSQYLTEPEALLSYLQETSTGQYPEPDQSTTISYLSKIYCNIINKNKLLF
jgi:hypothetical protein